MNRKEIIQLLIAWEKNKCFGFYSIYTFQEIEKNKIPEFLDDYIKDKPEGIKMLLPVGKRIMVKPVEVKQGTLIISNQKPTQFTVMGIGDEVTKVDIGTIIYLERYNGVEIDHEGEKFLVIDESSILAKLD